MSRPAYFLNLRQGGATQCQNASGQARAADVVGERWPGQQPFSQPASHVSNNCPRTVPCTQTGAAWWARPAPSSAAPRARRSRARWRRPVRSRWRCRCRPARCTPPPRSSPRRAARPWPQTGRTSPPGSAAGRGRQARNSERLQMRVQGEKTRDACTIASTRRLGWRWRSEGAG